MNTTLNKLMDIATVNQLIAANHILVLTAEEAVLRQLNTGNWIGGTIPYFMDADGGCINQEKVFVTDLTDKITASEIKNYDSEHIDKMLDDRPNNGFTYIMVPGFSKIHAQYALLANQNDNLLDVPTMGLVTGIHLKELGKMKPKVINGMTGEFLENEIIALHAQLPEGQHATIDIINIFEQGDGDSITFDHDGFEFTDCYINGKKTNFADYLTTNKIDTRLPLVADYSGAMINVSIQNVDVDNHSVLLYAPLLKGHTYKIAQPVSDYVESFYTLLPKTSEDIVISCNCVLNYVYSELDGQKTANITGPFTFGEIAYLLVNQTMVTLRIQDL